MPRERSPNRDKAFEIYKEHNGDITLREIANMLNEKEKTISNWKCRDKWDSGINCSTTKKECSTTKEKKNTKIKMKEPVQQEVEEVLNNSELTDKQRLFCIYYIKYFNATKAAIKAGYSKDTAYSQGPRLLDNVEVQKEIQRLKASKFKGALLEKEDLLQKYIDIAFADITDYLTFGRKEVEVGKDKSDKPIRIEVNYVDFNNSVDVDGTIISEVKQGKDGVSIRLQDKMKALEFLAKNIGLLDIATQQKLEIEQRKMALLEKQADDLDEDIEYIVEDETDEEKEN